MYEVLMERPNDMSMIDNNESPCKNKNIKKCLIFCIWKTKERTIERKNILESATYWKIEKTHCLFIANVFEEDK